MNGRTSKRFAALLLGAVLTGSGACIRPGPVCVPEAEKTPACISVSAAPVAFFPVPVSSAPVPSPAPIPVPAPTSSYFRRAGDPPETVVRDSEHGHWEYRSDTLGLAIDCVTTEFGRGAATYFVIDASVRAADGVYLLPRGAEATAEYPLALARLEKPVLLVSAGAAQHAETPCGVGPPLVADGEAVAGLSHAGGRGVDARAGIGLLAPNHYIAIVADGRQPGYSVGMTLAELASAFCEQGVESAYLLESGLPVALVFMGEHLNRHAGRYAGDDPSYQARIRRGLAFGKSDLVPDMGAPVLNDGNGNERPLSR